MTDQVELRHLKPIELVVVERGRVVTGCRRKIRDELERFPTCGPPTDPFLLM
jgi:hypothetical protein